MSICTFCIGSCLLVVEFNNKMNMNIDIYWYMLMCIFSMCFCTYCTHARLVTHVTSSKTVILLVIIGAMVPAPELYMSLVVPKSLFLEGFKVALNEY